MGTHVLGPGLGGLGTPVAGQEAGSLCSPGLTVCGGGVLIVHSLLLIPLALGAFLMVKLYFGTNTVGFKSGGSEDFKHKDLCVTLKLMGLDGK